MDLDCTILDNDYLNINVENQNINADNKIVKRTIRLRETPNVKDLVI